MSRANMDKNPDEVAAMFDGVAKRYDLVNDLLSLGRTKAWRKATTKAIEPRPGMKILDLAAGTGSSSEPLAAAGADVIPADFSEGMLAAGRKARPHLPYTKADALNHGDLHDLGDSPRHDGDKRADRHPTIEGIRERHIADDIGQGCNRKEHAQAPHQQPDAAPPTVPLVL
jgi:predicted TPR repeat methyltransferase